MNRTGGAQEWDMPNSPSAWDRREALLAECRGRISRYHQLRQCGMPYFDARLLGVDEALQKLRDTVNRELWTLESKLMQKPSDGRNR